MKKHIFFYFIALHYFTPTLFAYTDAQYSEAVKYGNIELVKKCVKSGTDPQKRIGGNDTALMFASDYGQTEIVRFLIFCKVDLNMQTLGAKSTALMMAASRGRMDIIQLLVKAGADVTIKNSAGSTAEDLARDWDHEEIADYLAKAKSNQR